MTALEAAGQRGYAPNDDTSYYVWHATGRQSRKACRRRSISSTTRARSAIWSIRASAASSAGATTARKCRKYNPPQAELFALITNGILNQKLPWILVLLGVAIAVVVELCGVSSLAVRRGRLSAALLVGADLRRRPGAVRRRTSRPQEAAIGPASELESEMSPGVLLSTGYIAGGTIAGVLIAFLNFSDTIRQHAWPSGNIARRRSPAAASFDGQCRTLAEERIGRQRRRTSRLERMAGEIRELNEAQLRRYVPVPKGRCG